MEMPLTADLHRWLPAVFCWSHMFLVWHTLAGMAWQAPCVQVIKKQMEEGVDVRRVGFTSTGAPARQHAKIVNEDGEEVCLIRAPMHKLHSRALAAGVSDQSKSLTYG